MTQPIVSVRGISKSFAADEGGRAGDGRVRAVDEYLAEKAVWVELTGGTRDPFVLG